jgi:hypothetical protein
MKKIKEKKETPDSLVFYTPKIMKDEIRVIETLRDSIKKNTNEKKRLTKILNMLKRQVKLL